jgi:hypothetical protein
MQPDFQSAVLLVIDVQQGLTIPAGASETIR